MSSSAERRQLYLQLADLESGSPRQWLFLHLAAQEQSGPVRPWLRLIRAFMNRFGPNCATFLPARLGLRGRSVYRLANRDTRTSALSWQCWSAAGLLFLHFLHAHPGLMRESAIIATVLASLISGLRSWIGSGRACLLLQSANAERIEQLPPSEAVLGLVGLSLAAGLSTTEAHAHTEALYADRASDDFIDQLALRSAGLPQRLLLGLRQMLHTFLLLVPLVLACLSGNATMRALLIALLPLASHFILRGVGEAAIKRAGHISLILLASALLATVLHRS